MVEKKVVITSNKFSQSVLSMILVGWEKDLTWNDASWTEGNGLRLIVEVADRAVQYQLANLFPGKLVLRPDLC